MKATSFEFRFRFWILLAIYALGFVAPWDWALHLDGSGPNTHVWGRLAIELSRAGVNIAAAFNILLALGILLAFAAAALRTWGSAYLGPEVMRDRALHGDTLVAAGPYRYVRNPLYLGSWLNTVALALLMPPTGAIFTIVLVGAFQLRLILAEEAFLAEHLGGVYADYCAHVPRLVPALRARTAAPPAAQAERPQWLQAALAEIFLWGTAASFAALGWRYDAHLLIQCVLVSLGVALVVRGVVLQPKAAA
jgi:protein-S-isoprenylcysteine O-methyltransferase Ste14